jgi:hypothetical protein
LQDPDTGEFYSQESYEKEVAENPTKQIVLYKMPPDDIPDWVAMPGVVMASDAMPVPGDWDQFAWDTPYENLPNMHPRAAGPHGRSLRLARENAIPLMQVLATFSYNPAKYLGGTGLKAMQVRGRMQEGMAADITVLNPETVTDNATYAEGWRPTTGIPYVIVNGEIVVEQERVLPAVFPGQPVRFPVEEEGRFEPLDIDVWRGQYLVAPDGFHGLDPEQIKRSEAPDRSGRKLAAVTPLQDTKASANVLMNADPLAHDPATGGDWFARSAAFRVPEEAHEVFCPIHRVMEPASSAHVH